MDIIYEVHAIDDVHITQGPLAQNHPKIQSYLKTLEQTYTAMTAKDFRLKPIDEYDYSSPFRINGPQIRWSMDFLQNMTGPAPDYMVYTIYTTVNSYGAKSWHLKISTLQPFLTITGKASVRYEVYYHCSLRLSTNGYPIMVYFEKGRVRPGNPLATIDGNLTEPQSKSVIDRVRHRWVASFLGENPTARNRSPLYEYDADSYTYCLQLVPYLVNPSIQTPLDLLKASLPKTYRRKDVYRALLSLMEQSSYEPVEVYSKIYPLILTLAKHRIDAYYLIHSLDYLTALYDKDRYYNLASLMRVPVRFWQVLLRRVVKGDKTPTHIAADAVLFAINCDFDELATKQLTKTSTITDLHDVCMRLDRRVAQQKRQEETAYRKAIGKRRVSIYARQLDRMRDLGIHPDLVDLAEGASNRRIASLGHNPEIEYKPGVLDRLHQAQNLINEYLIPMDLMARVPQEPSQLTLWGDIQGHCVGSIDYQKSLAKGRDMIFGIFDGDDLVSTLDLSYLGKSLLAEGDPFVPEQWALSQLASDYNSYRPWHSNLANSLEKEGFDMKRTFLGMGAPWN